MKFNPLVTLLASALLVPECGSRTRDARPAVPLNTAAVEVDGRAFAVDAAASTAVLYRSTNELIVTLNAANGSRVVVRIAEFRSQAGRYAPTDAVAVTGAYFTEVSPAGTRYFDPRHCAASARFVDITSFDSGQRTVSGTFSGTACSKGAAARTVGLANGQFHLRYTAQ